MRWRLPLHPTYSTRYLPHSEYNSKYCMLSGVARPGVPTAFAQQGFWSRHNRFSVAAAYGVCMRGGDRVCRLPWFLDGGKAEPTGMYGR